MKRNSPSKSATSRRQPANAVAGVFDRGCIVVDDDDGGGGGGSSVVFGGVVRTAIEGVAARVVLLRDVGRCLIVAVAVDDATRLVVLVFGGRVVTIVGMAENMCALPTPRRYFAYKMLSTTSLTASVSWSWRRLLL